MTDAVWVVTALLHREYPDRADFTIVEIRDRLAREPELPPMNPLTIDSQIRQHAVANRGRSPDRSRLLFATGRSTRRLFRSGDRYDSTREGGKITPNPDALPSRYADLLDWYTHEYAVQGQASVSVDPILGLRGLGRELWVDEDADAYVRRMRAGWD